MLNKTRQLYQQVLSGNKPTDADKQKAVEIAQSFHYLKDSPAWRQIQGFINRQREGAREYMEFEVGNINLLGMGKTFTTFIKYLAFLFENRAYKKIEKFVETSIEKGEKYARELERKAERAEKKS